MSGKLSCVICLESVEPDPGGGRHKFDDSCSEAKFCASFKCIRLNTSEVSNAWQRLRQLCSDSNGVVRSIPSVYCRKCSERNEAAFEILKKLEDLKLKCHTLKKELVKDLGGPTGSGCPSLANNLARLRMAVDAQRNSTAEDVKPGTLEEEEEDLKLFVEPLDEGGSPFFDDIPDSASIERDAIHRENTSWEDDLLRRYGIKEASVVLRRLTKARIRQHQQNHEETDVLLDVKSKDSSTKKISQSKDGIRLRSRKVFARRRSSPKPAKKRVKLESDYETENESSDEELVPCCTLMYCKKKFGAFSELKEHMHSDHGILVSDDEVDESNAGSNEDLPVKEEPSDRLAQELSVPGSLKNGSISVVGSIKRGLKCTFKNCPFQKSFANKVQRSRHMRKYHKRTMAERCPIAGCPSIYTLSSEEEKQRHLTMVHGDDPHPWRCDVCKEYFRTNAERLKHGQVEHANLLLHFCKICGMGFKHRRDLNDHNNAHSGKLKYSCKICQETFGTRIDSRKHRLTSHKDLRIQCDECGKCISIFSFRVHKKGHMDPSLWTCMCDVCGKKFPSNAHMVHHKRGSCRHRIETENKTEKRRNKRTDKPMEILGRRRGISGLCKWCSKSFVDERSIIQHVRTVHKVDEMPMPCHYLGCTSEEKFSTYDEWDAHIEKFHGDKIVKNHKCKVCNERFAKKSELNNHMITHSGKTIHKCDECPKLFTSISGLYLHVQATHKGRRYSCHICGVSYSAGHPLKDHMRTEHGGETKSYSCEVCGKQFKSKQRLCWHTSNNHTDPRSCELCGKSFKNVFTYRFHMRKVH